MRRGLLNIMLPLPFPNKLQQREDLQLDCIPGKAATGTVRFYGIHNR